MEGRFFRVVKFEKQDHVKSCPICGKEIVLATYPEEIGVRVLTIAVLIWAAWWGRQSDHGFAKPVVIAASILAVAWTGSYLLVRNKQRFRKP